MYKGLRIRKHKRVRKTVVGIENRPRLCVFKSHQHIYAQIIDDTKGVTVVSSSDLNIKDGVKKERAGRVGEEIAKKALAKIGRAHV